MSRLVTLSHEPSGAVEHGDIERDVVVAQRTARLSNKGARADSKNSRCSSSEWALRSSLRSTP